MRRRLNLLINGEPHRVLLFDDRDIDAITRKHTAFASFESLVNAEGDYRPTLCLAGKSKQAQREIVTLEYRYNLYMASRHDERRVHRGDYEDNQNWQRNGFQQPKLPGWYYLNADTPTCCVRIRDAIDLPELEAALKRERAKVKPRKRLTRRLQIRVDQLRGLA